MPALYMSSLRQFVETNPEQVLGLLTTGLANQGFDTEQRTALSWKDEICELQTSLSGLIALEEKASEWAILLEYVLPIIRQRIDCVIVAADIVIVIEYKAGSSATARAALLQAQNYALNLRDFHEESWQRTLIPIAVGAFRGNVLQKPKLATIGGLAVGQPELSNCIRDLFLTFANNGPPIDPRKWNHSRYFPVPSIIEAATTVYRNHDVKELAFSRSGNDNLETTQQAIATAVKDAIDRGTKKLIIVTGVPGAGKTLAGLNAVQRLQGDLDARSEQASFLSGNAPLVVVLQEALKRNLRSSHRALSRSIKSRIREVHRFVRDSYDDSRAPADRLIVFDEAQRAWTAPKNRKKFDRDVSEPEMVLEIMGRHSGWAVIVALIGGGQEIHAGEAGLAAWGDAISRSNEWEVVTSPEAVTGGPAVAGSKLFRSAFPDKIKVQQDPALHLAISKRSFETEVTASWVNAMLNGEQAWAAQLSSTGLPIYLTRSIEQTRRWLRCNAIGGRRAGLIASSGAARLRADGVEAPTFSFLGGVDYPKWFLEPQGDHRSSNQLEIALSEFELQGLELDLVGLLWGGDLIFPEGRVVARAFRGTKWCLVSKSTNPEPCADDRFIRIQNKYRVLLTRFRKAMVIFVPTGSSEDQTRDPDDLDSVYNYLMGCGVKPLSDV